MYNETLRKITSLSLLTILLTSTAAFAMPNALPQAHASTNANLFVSAENSQFNNYFAGPQVIQVIVSDPDIQRLDQNYGEPTVTVNGKKLRMVQATDGNWYAYFADSKQAQIADAQAPVVGRGLNFGTFCAAAQGVVAAGFDLSETKGFAVAGIPAGASGIQGSLSPAATIVTPNNCQAPAAGPNQHVVRESKTPNGQSAALGQIGILANAWPLIQLYDFSSTPASVVVQYQKAGGVQSTTLTFDRIPTSLISTALDRTAYPQNSQVFITMTDPQLNIDPTEEDSWTFGASTTNPQLFYQAFDRNGNPDAEVGAASMVNIVPQLTPMMFNHNGKFTLNAFSNNGQQVVDFQSTGKQTLNADPAFRGNPTLATTAQTAAGVVPITFIETGGVNTGIFGTWDGAKKSDVITNAGAIRGQTATFRYNDVSTSIVGGFGYASLSTSPINGTWLSGQKIPVTLVDTDQNKNSKITEHLDNSNPAAIIPAMSIGTPFSATQAGATVTLIDPATTPTHNAQDIVDMSTLNLNAISSFTGSSVSFSTFGTLTSQSSGAQTSDPVGNRLEFLPPAGTQINSGIVIDPHQTMATLKKTIHDTRAGAANTEGFKGFNFINYDVRSITNAITAGSGQITGVNIILLHSPVVAGVSPSIIDPNTGNVRATVQGVILAGSTNLEDLINLSVDNAQNGVVKANNDNNLFGATIGNGENIAVLINILHNAPALTFNGNPVVVTADFFSFGIIGDGKQNNQRINNAIYRWELEETGDNTSTFTGTTEYLMLNQLNILNPATYVGNIRPITHDVKFVAIQDMLKADSRAPQITYFDIGSDGQTVRVSAQQDITTHTGVVSFDSKTYKIADTVTVTLNDPDLNVDSDLIDVYTVVAPNIPANPAANFVGSIFDPAAETVGAGGLGFYADNTTPFGRLLDIQFGQQNTRWMDTGCFAATGPTTTPGGFNVGFADTGFSLVETGPATGIFTGTFEIPDQFCNTYTFNNNVPAGSQTVTNIGVRTSSVGQNIKVNYVDFRDDSSKTIEVSDNAGVRGNTGSITLDKSVYPVPFGTFAGEAVNSATTDFSQAQAANVRQLPGVFPLHRDTTAAGIGVVNPAVANSPVNTLANGDTVVHIRVNDQDWNTSAGGTDTIGVNVPRAGDATGHGPVWITLSRQGASNLLAFAGGQAVVPGVIKTSTGTLTSANAPVGADAFGARDLGPMTEISPDAGIFQADLPIHFTDGPQSADCPVPQNWVSTNGAQGFGIETTRFDIAHNAPGHVNPAQNFCVRQGDVLTVYYQDNNDASGNTQIVTDSATFDLRNGVLQSDKSVYIIGSDMILTLVEPDLNLDSQTAETAPLDLIEWDSHAFKNTMGPIGGAAASFDAKPSTFVETGKDTGIFQSVIKIPRQLGTTNLERGEQIHLEYTDWGPAGSKTVGANNQDIELTIYTSNFGATVELDQKVYTWTDRVYITIVAPDHNFDPNLIDTIGDNADTNKVTVSTRGNTIPNTYKLVETGVDTGIFTGYVILTGDNNLKAPGGVDGAQTEPVGNTQGAPNGVGPTDGFLPAEDSDGVSVSFEFTRDQTVTGSALIRWNIGEIKWLEASYPANGQGVLQIVDPDMNLNPKAVDKFDTNVWSDSDSGGIKLTMTETGEATGIFQGTVYFTTNFQSSGNRLHVAEGDTVTGEYKDRTLPAPYTPADQLRLTSTTFIGTVVPPLERAPASNPRIVDSFGNALTSVKVNQQIQVTADLTNGQDRDQPFAYLVQIQDANGVTVSLSWITGTLTGGQSLNPAQSWTPTATGTYTAQIFVWQSIDNPNALSPPLSTTITVA